ncbi:sulfurtransferase TusA family protein [Acinetobacter rathckeae]|uniref:sulfurtransferase TusA family protein n=1 Tax=Acinetobacter rathckeae TaxID=2605272 RepID=UPI0018A25328|nr:sulfurtransferase TusA family protein [Acinetobacter rathckeae]MBF7687570.1 sulfurtransferase TusA family protein [Acinetobacter rathckeae]MBF7694972.1 sulfurtransferase TusA family protein [Acinetobacter rathckeae]
MTSQHVQNFVTVDATNKTCPLPLLMLKRAIKDHPHQPLKLITSDPNSEIDILRFCQLRNIHCTLIKISEVEFHFCIQFNTQNT